MIDPDTFRHAAIGAVFGMLAGGAITAAVATRATGAITQAQATVLRETDKLCDMFEEAIRAADRLMRVEFTADSRWRYAQWQKRAVVRRALARGLIAAPAIDQPTEQAGS